MISNAYIALKKIIKNSSTVVWRHKYWKELFGLSPLWFRECEWSEYTTSRSVSHKFLSLSSIEKSHRYGIFKIWMHCSYSMSGRIVLVAVCWTFSQTFRISTWWFIEMVSKDESIVLKLVNDQFIDSNWWEPVHLYILEIYIDANSESSH